MAPGSAIYLPARATHLRRKRKNHSAELSICSPLLHKSLINMPFPSGLAVLLYTFLNTTANLYFDQPLDSQLNSLLTTWENCNTLHTMHYQLKKKELYVRLSVLTAKEKENTSAKIDSPALLQIKLEKIQIRDSIYFIRDDYELSRTITRYKKGLELMRLLYEKILGLDYHFTSMKTYHKVAALSNPNNYPEFIQVKTMIDQNLHKKSALELPDMLNANPYFSAAYSVVASVVGRGQAAAREKNLEAIACILDFSVRMNSQLSLIYYETEFLKESNASLKKNCQLLFEDFVKPLGYPSSLNECRRLDDWENVYKMLTNYATRIKGSAFSDTLREEGYYLMVDLEFAVNRLINFINQYADFVSQGEKYYHKFQIITNSYANEEICTNKLPIQFADLKKDISFSIRKFDESYNLTALQGSKLKDLLYGTQH